jgi:hypothetical protein
MTTLVSPKMIDFDQDHDAGFRNLLINGDCRIDQISGGNSITGWTNAGGVKYVADRWSWAEIGAPSAVMTLTQSAHHPRGTNRGYSILNTVTTAQASAGADDLVRVRQRLEGSQVQHIGFGTASAQPLTLSFWVKATKTGTYSVRVYRPDGTKTFLSEYTVNTTDTWERKVVHIPADTSDVVVNDNSEGLRIAFPLMAGSNRTGSTLDSWFTSSSVFASSNQVNALDTVSNNWRITDAQLEIGPYDTAFEWRPLTTELDLCRRYYQKSYLPADIAGDTGTLTSAMGFIPSGTRTGQPNSGFMFNPIMRDTPTLTVYSPDTGTADRAYDYNTDADVTLSSTVESAVGCRELTSSGWTANTRCYYHWVADAEFS